MISNGRQAVGGTATKIDGRTNVYSRLYVHNDDTTKDLFIGGPGVTALNGFKIGKLESKEFDLPPLTDIYMVSDGGAHNVSWIRIEIK